MTPERWQQIAAIVEGALDLEPDQRTKFLKEACGSDSTLRPEIDALLSCENDVLSSFLQSPPVSEGLIAGLHAITASTLQSGQLLDGRFQLTSKLGEGGMGQVWLAEQTTPVRRQVAIKLIRAGMYDEAVVQRFQLECQSLAVMAHPAIARIFEAGTTQQGQPYFVMEYVPGLPITEYCDQKKLKIADRLKLFIQVCEGVQHAHQKAIIHRDLKPANILVMQIDRKPVPRVIDFGLAKAVDPQLEGSVYTHLGHFVGTPEYMSPEQADPVIKDIDTRTDVYSLGAVLYLLLSGSRPFDRPAGDAMPLDEFLRRLREDEPPSPSERVSQDRVSSGVAADARCTSPRQLVRSLRGDLDWITMKALDKDRNQRYATPSELASDIQNYLNSKPVIARPAGRVYRVRKYVRRHRVTLTTASTVALVLVGATVISTREGMRANREGAVAQAVNEFLQNDLLAQAGVSNQSAANANTSPDPDLRVRTVLDRAAERIGAEFRRQPDVEAALRDTIGWTYMDLGLYTDARKQLKRAVELRRQVLGANNAKTLKSMARLSTVARLQGNYAEAEALQSHVLDAQRRLLGPENPDTLWSANNLAIVYKDQGKDAQAEALDIQILEIRKRVLGVDHPDTLKSLGNLGVDYVGDGKYAQAEELFTQALESEKRVLGPEHPDTVASLVNLAGLYFEQKKYDQSESLFDQALEIHKRVLGLEHPDTALNLYDLSCVAAQRGDKERAIALLSQSVDHGLAPNTDLGIERDTDLNSLHGDPRFIALVAHAKQVGEAKLKAASTVGTK